MSDPRRIVEIREAIKCTGKKLNSVERDDLSRAVINQFLSRCKNLECFKVKNIAVYRNTDNEIQLNSLFQKFRTMNANLYYPKILNFKNGQMEMFPVKELGLDEHSWVENQYGIQEPSSDNSINPANLDFIFIPGIAFGLSGERLGMGAGFYDRYLEKASMALRIALCFDFQILPALKQEIHDQPVDWVLSEAREFQNHRAKEYLAKI